MADRPGPDVSLRGERLVRVSRHSRLWRALGLSLPPRDASLVSYSQGALVKLHAATGDGLTRQTIRVV